MFPDRKYASASSTSIGPAIPIRSRRPIAIWRFSSPVRRALAIQALFSFGLWGVSSTVMNLYLHGAGFSNDVIGYVNSMPAVAAILFGLPVASASDRYGRRPFLVTGTLVAGPLSNGSFSCPSGQLLFLDAVSYSNTVVSDATGNSANSTPDPISATLHIRV